MMCRDVVHLDHDPRRAEGGEDSSAVASLDREQVVAV